MRKSSQCKILAVFLLACLQLAITFSFAFAQTPSSDDGWVEDPNIKYIPPPQAVTNPAPTQPTPSTDPAASYADLSQMYPFTSASQSYPASEPSLYPSTTSQYDPSAPPPASFATAGQPKPSFFHPTPLSKSWLGQTADRAKRTIVPLAKGAAVLGAVGGAVVGGYYINKSLNKSDQSNPQSHWVNPYVDKFGNFHPGHLQTNGDNLLWNNYGYSGNFNPNIGRFTP